MLSLIKNTVQKQQFRRLQLFSFYNLEIHFPYSTIMRLKPLDQKENTAVIANKSIKDTSMKNVTSSYLYIKHQTEEKQEKFKLTKDMGSSHNLKHLFTVFNMTLTNIFHI